MSSTVVCGHGYLLSEFGVNFFYNVNLVFNLNEFSEYPYVLFKRLFVLYISLKDLFQSISKAGFP